MAQRLVDGRTNEGAEVASTGTRPGIPEGSDGGDFEALRDEVKRLKERVRSMEALLEEYERIEEMERKDCLNSKKEDGDRDSMQCGDGGADDALLVTVQEIQDVIKENNSQESKVLHELDRLGQIDMKGNVLIRRGCEEMLRDLMMDCRPRVASAASILLSQWTRKLASSTDCGEEPVAGQKENNTHSMQHDSEFNSIGDHSGVPMEDVPRQPDEEKIRRARARMARVAKEYNDRRNSRVSKVIGVEEIIVSQSKGSVGGKPRSNTLGVKRSNGMTKVINALKRVKR